MRSPTDAPLDQKPADDLFDAVEVVLILLFCVLLGAFFGTLLGTLLMLPL